VLPLEEARELTQYDISPRMIPFLDAHLIMLLLDFAQESGIYKHETVSRGMLSVLSQTNMIDFAVDMYQSLGDEPPAEMLDRREVIIKDVENTRAVVLSLLQILENPDQVKKIPGFKSIEDLCTDFQIETNVINELARYAKLQYEMGNYQVSAEILKHYRAMPQTGEGMSPKYVSCYWGSLASALLSREFDDANELIFKMDEYLDQSKAPKKDILLHRTWLLHWALFAIFSVEKVEPKLLDFLLNEKSLSIISLSCPHLFRYVGACLILQKRLKHLVKDTVWIIHHEASSYSDPVTRFLLALYTEMDYDEAQGELQKCEQVCKGDYFLAAHWPDFQENARLHIFESYCRIHQCINIEMIATRLNMQAEEAELWIVKLIQNAKLDARIDSEKSRVVMTKAPPNVYQQVIEKTKNLAFRSSMLVSKLEKGG